tara:strand:- start:137137 stop:137628 length:492 start_codon:yes stop_codon:yes gene_type:complete
LEVILVRVTKNGQSTPVPLSHERTLIGRHDDCQIRVPIAGMSRKHCEITISDGSIQINDLGSSNGTFVNQERVSGATPLSAGDLISFGGLVFLVSVNGEPGDIDAAMMFEDGICELEELVEPAAAKPAQDAPVKVPASVLDNDESSMMDFEFDFDDDDDQPPL